MEKILRIKKMWTFELTARQKAEFTEAFCLFDADGDGQGRKLMTFNQSQDFSSADLGRKLRTLVKVKNLSGNL